MVGSTVVFELCTSHTNLIQVTYRPKCAWVYLKGAPRTFLPARHSKRGLCYGDVAGWVAGWLDVTRRYYIKTAEHIRKLFRLSESSIILVS